MNIKQIQSGIILILWFGLIGCTPPLKKAEEAIQKGKYSKAEPLLKQVLTEEPNNPDAIALLAQAQFYSPQLEKSLKSLHQLNQTHPQNHHFRRVFKEINQAFETLDQQINTGDEQALQTYIEQAPNPFFKSRVQWRLYQQLKQNGKLQAAETLKNNLQQSTQDPLLRQLLDWEQARKDIKVYPTLLQNYEKSSLRPSWYWALIHNDLKQQNMREANQWLIQLKKEAKEDNLMAEVLLNQAEANFDSNPVAALNYYRTFLKNHPKHFEGRPVIYKIRKDLAPHLGQEDHKFLAEAAYDRWMFQTAYSELSQQNYNHPTDLFKLGQYALDGNYKTQAQATFSQLSARFPGTLEAGKAQVQLASIERESKQYSAALSRLENVKTAYGSSPEVVATALWEEGKVYDHLNKYDQRADVYRKMVKLKPDHKHADEALWHVIWHFYLNKDYNAVIQWIEDHQNVFKESTLASRFHYWRGRAYEHLEKWETAVPIYQQLEKGYLLDYYTHRARERLRVIEKGGEDRYAVGNYQGYQQSAVKLPGYHDWFKRQMDARQSPTAHIPEIEELLYLQHHQDFMELAQYSDHIPYIIWRGILLNQQGKYYDVITRYRWPAESNNDYLPAAFPLAFFETISQEASKYQMNPFLVAGLIWQESQYKPDIKSWVGATGLMQIMPSTGANIATNMGLTNYELTHPNTNIKMGTWYLNSRHDVFDGNSLFAVASYNAGAGPVYRWKREFGHLPLDALAESITYPETRNYVKKVFTSYWIYEHLYGKN